MRDDKNSKKDIKERCVLICGDLIKHNYCTYKIGRCIKCERNEKWT